MTWTRPSNEPLETPLDRGTCWMMSQTWTEGYNQSPSLQGSVCDDWCIMACLPLCGLCQMVREQKMRGCWRTFMKMQVYVLWLLLFPLLRFYWSYLSVYQSQNDLFTEDFHVNDHDHIQPCDGHCIMNEWRWRIDLKGTLLIPLRGFSQIRKKLFPWTIVFHLKLNSDSVWRHGLMQKNLILPHSVSFTGKWASLYSILLIVKL